MQVDGVAWILVSVASLLAVLAFVRYLISSKRKFKLPPGPICLPFVANTNLFQKRNKLEQLQNKFGNIFGLYLNKKYVVVINDYNSLKEVLLDKELIIPNNDEARNNLKNLKNLLKGVMQYFLNEIEKSKEKPLNFMEIYINSISDIICDLVHPEKLESKHSKRKQIRNAVDSLLKHVHSPDVHLPWDIYTQKGPTIWDADKLHVIATEVIKAVKHETTNGYTNECLSNLNSTKQKTIKDDEVTRDIDLLLLMASLTVTNLLEWTMLVLATNLDIQLKCRMEVDSVIEEDIYPDWSKSDILPYTKAVMMEVQRLYCVQPVTIIQKTVNEMKIKQYEIPKESLLLCNLWAIHHDSMYWLEPNEFLPERFLSSNHRSVSKPEFFIPLSFDKSGETMVDVLIWYFVVSLLQRFTFQSNQEEIQLGRNEQSKDFAHKPTPFRISFSSRN